MTTRKKAIGVTLLLLLYFVIAIIGFMVVFFLKNTSSKTPPTNHSQTKNVALSPIPTGFKEYSNAKQKFKVSYPEDLSLKEQSYGFGVNTVELRTDTNKDTANAPDVQILTVPKAIAKAVGQDFDIYYDMPANSTKIISGKLKGIEGEEQFTKVKNREIQGLRAVEYSSLPTPNKDNVEAEIGVFIETGNDMTIIATGESQREDLEKILATFTYPLAK